MLVRYVLATVSGSRLAIAEGHGVVAAALAAGASPVDVVVDGGRAVTLLDAEAFVVLPRHGVDEDVLPHLVDHEANMRAAHAVGCDRVVALSSVGGLRRDLGVGSLVVPDDVIALDVASPLASVPTFDRAWRMLRMRRVLVQSGDGYAVLPRQRELVSYYANSIAHLLGPFEAAVRQRDALQATTVAGIG